MNGPAPEQRIEDTSLLAAYRPLKGAADELFNSDGTMRAVWTPLIRHLSELDKDELAEHFARGDAYLRDAGVYYRQYSNDPAPERDWPLSHLPVLIHEAEWSGICEGLAQRADLLEQVMADLYGPATLVRDGHLPAELVAKNPQWLRPMVGVTPASGHYLHLLAFEISRNPDGTWFVLGDRAQAPSGAGFALENRMATIRMFADLFSGENIHRLAGFFASLRETLTRLSAENGGQPAIMTPGPNNDIYFEHMFIARYLGLMLLEGEDMIVEDGRLMVRTVKGLEPLGALWRRLDSGFADPLELDSSSFLGTPGLINTLRQGSLSMVNALGSGVVEMRALMAFLPKISNVLLGEPLKMHNIATWWCGQDRARDYVIRNAERMMIGSALAPDLLFESPENDALSDWQTQDNRAQMLVGQELVNLSTTPAYDNGELVARPMTVRVTAARGPKGWVFMPGGYARIGRSGDATALAMQRGGSVADVWIVSDTPVSGKTLLSDGGGKRSEAGILPSRAAENLYWLGRYVERTEAIIRHVRAYHLRLAETGNPDSADLRRMIDYNDGFGVDLNDPVPAALVHMLGAARGCAGKVRDRFSIDGWAALNDLAKTVSSMTKTVRPGDDCARAMGVLLRKITGFNGLVHENMYRFSGWRFLAFGRAIERVDGLAAVLAGFAFDEDVNSTSPDIALELGDSVMAHRRRYRGEVSRETVVDLLALDPNNPRAILFHLNRLRQLSEELTVGMPDIRDAPLRRAVLPLETQFSVTEPQTMTPETFLTLRSDLAAISDLLSSLYLR